MWLLLRRTRQSAAAAAVALTLVAPVPIFAEAASSQTLAVKTGTIKIRLITPPGVPATVLLRKKRETVAAAKPAAGKVYTSKVKVAPGTWKPTAQPLLFENRYFVPTTSTARAVVRAGRTTTVTVKWKSVPVARQLKVTAMTTTSLRLSFLRPGSKSKVAVRYAAGDSAPRSVKDGKSAAVSGTTVGVAGLSTGQSYSFSLFTKVDRKWLGPVPLTATTSAAPNGNGNGNKAIYITDPATVLVPRGSQLGSEQLASGRVDTLLPPGVVPVIGTPVVLPTSTALPGGFIGTIVGVARDGKHVTLAQTALATAFDYLKLEAPSLALARVTTSFEPEPKRAFARAGECEVGGATSVSVEPSFDFGSSSLNVELASKEYLGLSVVKGLKLEARVVAEVSASISASISSTYTCSKTLGTSNLTFSLGPVPMMLTYSPTLEVQAAGQGTISGAVLNLKAGFEGSLYKPLIGGVDVDVKPVVSTSHTMPTASGLENTVEVSGRVGGTVAVGPGLGNGKLDVGIMAGLSASLSPLGATIKATFDELTHCVEMSAAGTASASVFAAAWLKGYPIDVSWKFWEGSFDYAGPWKAPVPCPSDEPRWVGTVKTTESYVSVNSDGSSETRASQTTTYNVAAGEGSTFTSSYTDVSRNESPPCGTMHHSYAGTAAGPYPTLNLRTVPDGDGGYVGQLFGVDDDHFHDGTRYGENCTLVNGIYQTVGTSQPSQVVVYPPTHLGCVDTVFPVARGAHEINGTVNRECSSSGGLLRQTSTWTYNLRLDPCDLQVDSDRGGMPDCVESAYGLDPANPTDD